MRYFYDCEFLEDGRTIDLMSIGIVADDGQEYYAVNLDAPWKRIYKHKWLCEHVLPSLPRIHGDERNRVGRRNPYALDFRSPVFKRHKVIADEVREFLLSGDFEPELWAWYAAFDHVALAWLWGPMIDLPKGIPMLTKDLKQRCDDLGNPTLPEQPEGEHNALEDARHNLVRAQFMDGLRAL